MTSEPLDDQFPITLRPTGDGCYRIEYPERPGEYGWMWSRLNQLPDQFRAQAGEAAPLVRFGSVVWAGPYEIYMAITAGVAAAGALGQGVAALLSAFARENPSRPITYVFNDNTTFVINGSALPPAIEARINAEASANATAPSELERPPESITGNGRVPVSEFHPFEQPDADT